MRITTNSGNRKGIVNDINKAVDEQGFEALKSVKPSGRQSKLTTEQQSEIDIVLPQGMKYAIVMDNAPWHKKMYRLVVTEKLDEYADIRDNVEFIMLPPYSPDLNPIEQVLIRRHFPTLPYDYYIFQLVTNISISYSPRLSDIFDSFF